MPAMSFKSVGFSKIYLYRRIVQAKLFIDKHYHQPLNIDDIADEAYFSKYHFIRLFKTTYNKTPHQYLTGVRIEHARLLLQKGASVNDACYAVGFESSTSFSILFKRITGYPPSVYRQHQLARNEKLKSEPRAFIPNCFSGQMGWLK